MISFSSLMLAVSLAVSPIAVEGTPESLRTVFTSQLSLVPVGTEEVGYAFTIVPGSVPSVGNSYLLTQLNPDAVQQLSDMYTDYSFPLVGSDDLSYNYYWATPYSVSGSIVYGTSEYSSYSVLYVMEVTSGELSPTLYWYVPSRAQISNGPFVWQRTSFDFSPPTDVDGPLGFLYNLGLHIVDGVQSVSSMLSVGVGNFNFFYLLLDGFLVYMGFVVVKFLIGI